MNTKVLLVEDDNSLGYILKEYLEMHDFETTLARNGEEGYDAFKNGEFDICILDVMMPKKDGFTLAREIRTYDERVPVIFLTAKALKVDKLKGFKIGADDYIVKPVDEEELIARINAVLKRTHMLPLEKESINYQIGNYFFDFDKQELKLNGERTELTTKEAEILKALCERKGKVLERNEILKSLWGQNDYFTRRSMDVFISKLRKYLNKDESIKIRNIHGKGFVLEV